MSSRFFEFFCPVKVIAGKAALEHLPWEMQGLSVKRPMIVTDKGIHQAGLLEPVLAACREGGVQIAAIFDDVPPDSSTSVVREIATLYRDKHCDAIIALGGGSAIDTGKAANILVSMGGDDLEQYSGAGILKHPLRPFFVIPTTAGTGSEVTSVAVISDEQRGVKLPFTSSFLLPDAAIIDPRMTLTLPPHITAATAMDALTHATEAFIGLAKNPLSDAYATAAIQKIGQWLLPVMNDPKNEEGRLELALASTMAGIAFSNSMVGLVHALGHATGAKCHLPHGVCMSLYLPYALEYNLEYIREPLGELLLHLEGPERYAQTPTEQRAESCIAAIRALRDQLHQRCGLPRTLEETGQVEFSQLEAIAQLALDDGAILFSPQEVSFEDAHALVCRAWS
ncbi:iron-containing alcohol dehydrogenase [Marinobacter persicus]|uniref:Alcohol dehydrogenase n=1 Tax=Marinobacter persicus TaxID=930118 RepID=A0A2S6G7T6_9GAMM|nr:iron-containing alcohol dehydrogenase [Marinobacter persicus]PPK52111.1 alcohol dehydrogenase [Marinobacter persicus]PPK55201.1 alcohol dehydrogenase [Marinobacter persicus]PPK58871.1 alcohol dehydrogenase [Marinobacter persicus]